ncbi:MAG: ribokinase [Armatimonadota bacterium]|nr:ribokinase [Armatimonadota bacterium]MDR7449357.1 ribokinase [Armatimonadota bacterium]MDR7458357.1 ribokinase [Armatimonadota bacterium]MDR7478838.1 ribokinase [Armatimonadota bacterium]MDR7488724.1 ribokinase [Armatimonadota bacterium]
MASPHPPAPQLVVIGSLNMDLTVRVPRLPGRGETVVGSDFFTAHGGKGANQAVAAARLGARVRLVGRVGRDAFGAELQQALAAEGIDAAAVRHSDRPTGVALIVVEEGGQNLIAVAPGANGDVRPEDVEALDLPDGVWVGAVLEVPDGATVAAFRRARAVGGRTLLNAAPSRPFAGELWRLTDVLVVNEGEAGTLAGRPVGDAAEALEAARVLRERGPRTVAVTLGRQGAVLLGEREAWHVPAVPVDAVDATGAGDAWVAALTVGLAEGRSLVEAGVLASAAGALAASRPGAQPSLPARAEVEALAARAPRPVQLT